MKFSSDGIEKVCDLMVATYDDLESWYNNPRGLASQLEKYEFEPSDFKGMVCLTIEQANAICGAMNPTPSDCKLRNWFENYIDQASANE